MTGGITLWKDRGYEVEVPRSLTAEQRERYCRHLLVPEVGDRGPAASCSTPRCCCSAPAGSARRPRSTSPRPGVGTIGIVDDDVVDLSNLQRQVIHTTDRHRHAEGRLGRAAINALNPDVKVVKYQTRLDASNIMEIIEGYDVIVDGVDNFPTRYLLNDASVRLQIPVVSAAILGFEGQLSVFEPYDGPCYRCLFPVPPPAELAPSCGANGVLGVLPGTMGLLQATEVIKLIIGSGDPLDRPAADVRRARRDDDRAQGPPRPRVPDLLARSRRRSPTTRWASSPTTRRSAPRPASRSPPASWPRSNSPGAAPVGRRRARGHAPTATNVGDVLAPWPTAHPDTRASSSAATASSTATSTSTSTTRTSACSTGWTPRSPKATRS